MDITPQTQVSEIVTHHPGTTRVFQRHGIDFCCGGKRPLGEVVGEHGLDLGLIRRELDEVLTGPTGEADEVEKDWSEAPLNEVIDHIVAHYHQELREELPRLSAMAEKVLRAHGERFPTMVPPVVERLRALRTDMESHMMKEERMLFPYIAAMEQARMANRPLPQAPFGSALGPIHVMEAEHEEAGALLADMSRLTGGYVPPEGACNTFRGLFHGLAELERELHLHVHLENNILFPRALDMERRATGAA
jgi:regulator of cell morphogenesis and NO signaling